MASLWEQTCPRCGKQTLNCTVTNSNGAIEWAWCTDQEIEIPVSEVTDPAILQAAIAAASEKRGL